MTPPPARPPARLGLFAARLLLMIGAVTLIVAGAELATRWVDPTVPTVMVPQAGNCLQRSSTLSKALLPNCTGNLFGTPIQTNSLGMRGPELRDDGSQRILALGDSCTMGWRVEQDESYPAVLQSLLDARPDGPRVQLLNAGVAGYTSHQGLVYLRESGLALDPDVVIIGFGWNDATPLGDVVEQIEAENRRLWLMRLDDWLLVNSRFYRWARSEAHEPRATSAKRPPRVALPQTRRNLNAMATLATEHGARVIFLNFLRPANLLGHSPAIEGAAADSNAPLITYEGERIDIVHPTAGGYRWLAERIADTLDEHGYLAADGDRPPSDR